MKRSDLIALGLVTLVTGAVSTTAKETVRRPVPPPNGRLAYVVRTTAPVRQAPSLTAPTIGTLSQGDRVLIDVSDTSFPGFSSIIREWLEGDARFARGLGWIESSAISFDPVAVAMTLRQLNPRAVVQVGAIGGHHSLAETRDLLAVADYRFKEVGEAMAEMRLRPSADPAVKAALQTDWATLSKAWSTARRAISLNLIFKRAAFPIWLTANAIPTEDEWVRTLSFVQGQELVKGSLQDITLRLERALRRQILFEAQPGQTTTDIDLELFKDLDSTIRTGEAAAERVGEAAKSAITSPTGLVLGSTLLVAGGGLLLLTFLPEIRLALTAGRAAFGRRSA